MVAIDIESEISCAKIWLENTVIGLNLCPFAKAVHIKKQIRYQVSRATTPEELLRDLIEELHFLADADVNLIDTTLLIHPAVLADFLDYNDFLEIAGEALVEAQLDGILQIASFHPQYQFEGTAADDIENYTNRSPSPMLHILRESSVEAAIESFTDPESIPDRNIEMLRGLSENQVEQLKFFAGSLRPRN
jgi:uncharacterized protein